MAVRLDKDRLASRVKTLDRDLATVRTATGRRPPAQTGKDEPESLAAGGGGGAIPPAFVTF